MTNLTIVLEALYLSEINCIVESFWDSGWSVKLGDSMNGYKDHCTDLPSLAHVAEWLTAAACVHWPDSGFALNVYDLSGWLTSEAAKKE